MPRKKRSKNKKILATPDKVYNISVKVFGRFWTSKGKTLEEAISNLTIPNARGVSVWKVEYDGKTQEKIVQPMLTSRLFSLNGLAKEIALKQFKTLFT